VLTDLFLLSFSDAKYYYSPSTIVSSLLARWMIGASVDKFVVLRNAEISSVRPPKNKKLKKCVLIFLRWRSSEVQLVRLDWDTKMGGW